VLYGIAALFLVLPAMLGRSPLTQRVLGNRVLAWLGTVSYGVYLWHLPFLLAIQRWFGWGTFSGHFTVLWLLTSLVATAVAALSWYLLERPLLRHASAPWWSGGKRDDAEHDGDREQAQQLADPTAGERVG
jgi:peptidoglycan/LPS O-acetylase OafA/YrhL